MSENTKCEKFIGIPSVSLNGKNKCEFAFWVEIEQCCICLKKRKKCIIDEQNSICKNLWDNSRDKRLK